MTKTELKKLFLIINNFYSSFQIDDLKTEMWLVVLSDYPFERAQKNLMEHIKTNKFAPTAAEIIDYDYMEWTVELYELKEGKDEALYTFIKSGGQPEAFDSSMWDKQIEELERIMPPKKPAPWEKLQNRSRDKEIVARDRDMALQRWVEEGKDPDEFR
ncbi:hypothetical protein ACX1C1_05280 [Paenibacillus sp. strain BS8-2]